MAVAGDFVRHALEQLSGLRAVASRRMFGGVYLALRIEVQRPPAQAPSRLLAALPLTKCVASGPLTQLRSDLIRGNDFRIRTTRAVPMCVCAGDTADRHAVDCGADVGFPGRAFFQCQPVQDGEIIGVHQRPVHLLAADDPHRVALDGIGPEPSEDTRRRAGTPSPGGSRPSRCRGPRAPACSAPRPKRKPAEDQMGLPRSSPSARRSRHTTSNLPYR